MHYICGMYCGDASGLFDFHKLYNKQTCHCLSADASYNSLNVRLQMLHHSDVSMFDHHDFLLRALKRLAALLQCLLPSVHSVSQRNSLKHKLMLKTPPTVPLPQREKMKLQRAGSESHTWSGKMVVKLFPSLCLFLSLPPSFPAVIGMH